MEFVKKNYEKVLLGLVLFGLVVAVAFLPFLVANEKQAQEDRRNKIFSQKVPPLAAPDLSGVVNLLKRAATPLTLDFSAPNRLFNPMDWQRTPDGRMVKVPTGGNAEKVEVTQITPLYFILTLDRIELTPDSEPRYGIGVEHEANRWRRGPYFVSKGEKKDYTGPSGKKESFTLAQVEGSPDNPRLTLQSDDWPTPVTVTTNTPFKRVEAYSADLKFLLETNRPYLNRREGDKISLAGEDYKIDKINQNEVILIAPNEKKTTIRYNPPP